MNEITYQVSEGLMTRIWCFTPKIRISPNPKCFMLEEKNFIFGNKSKLNTSTESSKRAPRVLCMEYVPGTVHVLALAVCSFPRRKVRLKENT